MFIDAVTKKPVGPRISPVRVVVETRLQDYFNLIEDAETGEMREVASSGMEIVREILVAPESVPEPVIPNLGYWRSVAHGVAEHGRRCKKAVTSECPTCLKNIEAMSLCPVNILSEVL